MPARLSTTRILTSPENTAAFARGIAPLLHPGDTLLLGGQIGAGKTHFARALIQARLAAADIYEDVPSPTFTIVQTYDDGTAEIWHADLYRLTGPQEIEELGLSDAFQDAICLIEWPDRLGDTLPAGALHLGFTPGRTEDERVLSIETDAQKWQALLQTLDHQTGVYP